MFTGQETPTQVHDMQLLCFSAGSPSKDQTA